MKNELKKNFIHLLEIKKPRYMSKEFLSEKLGNEKYNLFLQETDFLNKFEKVTFSERIFCFLNDIKIYPLCKHCNKEVSKLKFENYESMTVEKYHNRFCNQTCLRNYEVNFNREIKHKDSYNKEELLKQIFNEDLEVIRRNDKICDWVKVYFEEELKIDYKDMSIIECLYFIKNNLKERPKCPICKENFVQYKWSGEYEQYCSAKCSANSQETKDKKKTTTLEKYGVENVFQNENIKEDIKKANVEKYGVDSYCKTEEYKERLKTGDIVKPPLDMVSIARKIKNTTYKKFERFSDKIIPLFSMEEYDGNGYDKIYKWKCVTCNHEFNHWYNSGMEVECPKCKGAYSDIEKVIYDFLISNNIPFKYRDKTLLQGFEIDFLLYTLNIGIEVNGLYWHSEDSGKKDHKYHLTKTEECEKKGIRLLQIFGDEIQKNKNIVISKLRHILKLKNYKIYARKTIIKPIDFKLKEKFLNKYHIQGNDRGSEVFLGMFYKNKLVSVMTFCKYRKALNLKHEENCWELSRFCGNYNFYILGGASKLLKYFEKNYKPKEIITYADRRWSNGGVYNELGFEFTHHARPSYSYTKTYYERFHRFNFRKNILKNKLSNFDESLTEWENMKNNGYDRIWDCGVMVFKKYYAINDLILENN